MTIIGNIADILSRLGIIHHSTTRHINIDVLAIGAMTLVTTTIATMFRNADSICQANGFQYILTINECSLDLLRQEMSDEEYKRLVQDTEVLELNDASDNGKLLGIHVDLKYE